MGQKKIIENILLCFLTILIVWMAGCGKDETQDPLNTTMETPLSTYRLMQTHEVTGVNSGNAFFKAMEKTENGFCVLYMDMEGQLHECHTADGGATWKDSSVDLDIAGGANRSATGCDINAVGEYAVLIIQMKDDYEFSGFQVVYVGKNDNRVIAEYADGVQAVRFNEAGDAILVCTDYEVEEYGVDGRLIRSYPVTGVMDMCFAEQEIIFLTNDAIRVYDGTSGEMVTEDYAFHQAMAEELQETDGLTSSVNVLDSHKLMRSDQNGALMILLESGMYRYIPGSAVIECIYNTSRSGVDRLDHTLSFVQEGDLFYLSGYLENDNTLYFACCSETDETDEAVEPVENVPAREITVYTLYSEEYLEYCARKFEEEYPDIKVNIEVGREEGSNTTITEAVNALNTRLLAGDGPDVILMDDLNYVAYRDSGMLKELSGLYDEILSENPASNTAVLSCYRSEDGTIYAIPSQFGFTMISAPADSIDSLNSLEGLAEYINQSSPNPEFSNDLRIYDAKQLFQLLYPAYSHRIFGNGESYDRQELENFMSGAKMVWDALMEHTTEEQIREWETWVAETEEEYGEWTYSNTLYLLQGLVDEWHSLGHMADWLYTEEGGMQLYSGRSIGLYNITYVSEIKFIWHMTYEYPQETYDIFTVDGVKTFTPLLIYSINAKSENTDAAEEFVKYMLSTETQSGSAGVDVSQNFEHRRGMSINMEVLQNLMEGCKRSMENRNPMLSDEVIDRGMEVVGSPLVPTYRNAILEEKIFAGMEEYLNGDITLEQYMEKTDNAIMLYMEE
ncbi:MAG: extracellular solute-binding protein [Lachnospiraceae bacterium]|nr:extracellular solute-binding protein [Lachnospiraceae bacterium]